MFAFILQRILDKDSSGAKIKGSSRNLSSYFILIDTELLFQYECSQRNMKNYVFVWKYDIEIIRYCRE